MKTKKELLNYIEELEFKEHESNKGYIYKYKLISQSTWKNIKRFSTICTGYKKFGNLYLRSFRGYYLCVDGIDNKEVA